ncbi:MAG: trimeric intracellular cation channel family protein [Prevotellaceae bacterium]|nr:trimeric intracellular cation channel family protein [Prevotellaceae bacterium]
MPTSFVVIEFLGTFAFALSGIRLASAKRFDLFGAFAVGLATAVGGGTIRDLLLRVQPFWTTNAVYFLCCAFAVVWVMAFRRQLVRQQNTWFLFDTLGLALFNVIGIEKSLNLGQTWWMAITMGCVTGAAGGVIRDLLLGEVPLIFRKEIYAVACACGGVVYILCRHYGVPGSLNAAVAILAVIATRLLAVRFHWHLPTLKGE